MLTRGSNRNRTTITITPSSGIENTSKKAKVNFVSKEKGKDQKKRTELELEFDTHSTEVNNLIVRKVLDRLNGSKQSLILHGIEKTKSDLMSNLKCAIRDYRGNSSILIGPRASGKSTLINQLIRQLQEETTSTSTIDPLILYGSLFAETQSVLRFLLGKLRAKLGESEPQKNNGDEEIEISEYVAFDQLSALIRRYFSPTNKKQRYLIFVLEDLERFAAHPQQNLLYCLFELALSLPVYVIGTSCRIDVLELLEKRVKSRFSQNIVYLPLPETRDVFVERIRANLLINHHTDLIAIAPSVTCYNDSIEEFIKNNQMFNDLCTFNFELTKDVRPIFRILSLTFSSIFHLIESSSLSTTSSSSSLSSLSAFEWKRFSERFELIHGPPRTELTILNASILETTLVELMILVAMCRLNSKFPSTPVTFEVMTEELIGCKLRAPGLEHFVWTKSTLQVAFDRLLSCRLLLLTGITNSGSSSSSFNWLDRSYLTVRLGLPSFVIIDSIERHPFQSKEIFALACERF